MTRRHICDVPGCQHTRMRWQRICGTCYGKLSIAIRNNLIAAHRKKRMKDWRHWKQQAGSFLEREHPCERRTVSATQSFEMQQRLLGER